jgi:hypothetical protein
MRANENNDKKSICTAINIWVIRQCQETCQGNIGQIARFKDIYGHALVFVIEK